MRRFICVVALIFALALVLAFTALLICVGLFILVLLILLFGSLENSINSGLSMTMVRCVQ